MFKMCLLPDKERIRIKLSKSRSRDGGQWSIRSEVRSWLCHLLALCAWVSLPTVMSFSFLIDIMYKITGHTAYYVNLYHLINRMTVF